MISFFIIYVCLVGFFAYNTFGKMGILAGVMSLVVSFTLYLVVLLVLRTDEQKKQIELLTELIETHRTNKNSHTSHLN